MEEYENSDLDFSFTSTTTDRTFATSSSSARSSLALSFNGRLSTVTATNPSRPHRHSDPHWSAITAATALSPLHLSHLKLLRLVGAGDLGRVFHCRLRDNDHSPSFALKVVDRDSLPTKKLCHVATEAEILSMLDHPFLPTLYARLEASHYTCLLMDYCPNGDLHSILRKQPHYRFSISAVRFYASEILVALEYLHSIGIVYRDLKPENVLIRDDGHVMLSDFDLCFRSETEPKLVSRNAETIKKQKNNCFGYGNSQDEIEYVTEFVAEPTTAFSKSCVGTHEYLAPELVSGNGHGNGVDWWAFGVLIHELLFGMTPFKGNSKEATLRNIASSRDIRFSERDDREGGGMAEAKDLIEKLLVKDPRQRLGCDKGATDIKRHPFFNGIKWPLIMTYKPPEVRGVVVKKEKKLGSISIRRRWSLKGVSCLFRRSKGSKYNLNCNSNYYCYSSGKAGKYV